MIVVYNRFLAKIRPLLTFNNTMQLELALEEPAVTVLDNFNVRVSKRARSVSLRVLPVTGLEVTIPRWFKRSDIPEVIAEHREWILGQFDKVQQRTDPDYLVWPPRHLPLRAVNRQLECLYATTPGSGASDQMIASIDGDQLVIEGYGGEKQVLINLLAAVLKDEARAVLAPWLRDLADQHSLSYKKVSIRGQRTLWGSYSSSGTLSLNYKLMFLPVELTRYVLLHELAHIRHLDHSSSFWSFLASMEPRARLLDRQLNAAGEYVPPWLEAVS